MRFLAICAALGLWASPSTAMEFDATEVAFAYSSHHQATNIPTVEMLALQPMADSTIDILRPYAAVEPDPAPPPREFSRHELCSAAASVAEANNLPIPFFANLIQQESGWRPAVVSPAGAQGIAQFMPRVARNHGLQNPFDPIHALTVSGRFLAGLVRQFGNLGLAAAAYNAGPKRVQDWMARRGKLPAETRDYVRNVTGYPAEQWANAKAAGLRLPAFARCPDAATLEAQALERAKPAVALASETVKMTLRSNKSYLLTAVPTGKKVTALVKSSTRMKVVVLPKTHIRSHIKAIKVAGFPKSRVKVINVALKSVPQIMAPERPAPRVRVVASAAKTAKPRVATTHGPHKPLNLQPTLANAKRPVRVATAKPLAKPSTKPAAAKRIRVASRR